MPGSLLCFVEYQKAKRPCSQINCLDSLENGCYRFREEGVVTAVNVSNQLSVIVNTGVHIELGRFPGRL